MYRMKYRLTKMNDTICINTHAHSGKTFITAATPSLLPPIFYLSWPAKMK